MNQGQLNRSLATAFLAASFAWAIWLDPAALTSSANASTAAGLRLTQIAFIRMALLHLVLSYALSNIDHADSALRRVFALSAAGAVAYTGGHALAAVEDGGGNVIAIIGGAVLNLAAVLALIAVVVRRPRGVLTVILPVVAFGLTLDVADGVFGLPSGHWLPAYLGAPDGTRLRMLRLARVAAIALPLLATFYEGLYAQLDPTERSKRVARWGRIGMCIGAVAMPTALVIAALSWMGFKYLLPIGADTLTGGTLAATWLAHKHKPAVGGLELWGWVLLSSSMVAGLLMGGYAFDGPLPTPPQLGSYDNFPRQIARMAHIYAIVLGVVSVFVSRELERRTRPAWSRRSTLALAVLGNALTLGALIAQPLFTLSPSTLALGPLAITAAIVVCVTGTAAATQSIEAEAPR